MSPRTRRVYESTESTETIAKPPPVPEFCTRCGGPLEERRASTPGDYDAFTGERAPENVYLSRFCPTDRSLPGWVSFNGSKWQQTNRAEILNLGQPE